MSQVIRLLAVLVLAAGFGAPAGAKGGWLPVPVALISGTEFGLKYVPVARIPDSDSVDPLVVLGLSGFQARLLRKLDSDRVLQGMKRKIPTEKYEELMLRSIIHFVSAENVPTNVQRLVLIRSGKTADHVRIAAEVAFPWNGEVKRLLVGFSSIKDGTPLLYLARRDVPAPSTGLYVCKVAFGLQFNLTQVDGEAGFKVIFGENSRLPLMDAQTGDLAYLKPLDLSLGATLFSTQLTTGTRSRRPVLLATADYKGSISVQSEDSQGPVTRGSFVISITPHRSESEIRVKIQGLPIAEEDSRWTTEESLQFSCSIHNALAEQ